MKKFIVLLLSVTVTGTLLFSGCSKNTTQPKNSTETTSNTESTKPVTLRFLWWGSQPRHDATVKVNDLYKQKYPNVTIESEYQSFDGYFQKLSMSAAANNMPDVFQFYVGSSDTQQFMEKKLVEPLDSYVSKKLIDVSDISESGLSAGKYNGKLYGLSLGANARALIVDPDAYQKAGLQIPTNGYATWDDLEKDLVKLKQVTGAYGADDLLSYNFALPYYLRQNGKVLYSDEKSIIGFDEKTYVDFYNMKTKWIKEGLVPTFDITSASKGIQDSEIVKKKSAISILYSNQYESAAKAAGKPLTLIPLPGPNASKGMDVRAGSHISMSSKSANKDEAAKFISYFMNDIDANKILNAERGMPVVNKVREALKSGFSIEQNVMASYMDNVSKNSTLSDPPVPAGVSEMDVLLKDLEQQIVYDKITPQAAYKQIQALAAKLSKK